MGREMSLSRAPFGIWRYTGDPCQEVPWNCVRVGVMVLMTIWFLAVGFVVFVGQFS